MDHPDACDKADAAAFQHANAQNFRTKQASKVQPSLADIDVIGRDLQHHSSHRVGSNLSKNDQFYAFFGNCANIALHLWQMMNEHYFIPQEAKILYLLWALFFTHVYPSRKVHVQQQVVPIVQLTPNLFASTFGLWSKPLQASSHMWCKILCVYF